VNSRRALGPILPRAPSVVHERTSTGKHGTERIIPVTFPSAADTDNAGILSRKPSPQRSSRPATIEKEAVEVDLNFTAITIVVDIFWLDIVFGDEALTTELEVGISGAEPTLIVVKVIITRPVKPHAAEGIPERFVELANDEVVGIGGCLRTWTAKLFYIRHTEAWLWSDVLPGKEPHPPFSGTSITNREMGGGE
jgi:hypothetical protein